MAIFTAIGTAIAGTAAITLFGVSISIAGLIAGALALGTQIAVRYLLRPKARTYAAIQGQKEFGARVPVWAAYGICKVKGHQVYYAKYGSGNKYNSEVFILSNGWCDGLEPYIYFFGEKHDLIAQDTVSNEVANYRVDGFGSKISIRFYDGRPGQLADSKLVSDTSSLGMNWKSTSVCAGMAYVVVDREYDSELFEKGAPDIDFILRGLRLYDPRKDSTTVGGSGTHRLNNSSTWEFSQNPALQRYNYQIGLRGLISNRTLIGEGKSPGQLELGSYIAAMNVCDTLREGKPTYQCGLIVYADDDHTEILSEFDDAMAGYAMNRRGLSGIIAGAPQTSVLTLDDDDIDMGRAKQLKLRKSAFELYNHLSGQYISKENNWNPESLKPITVNQDVADDGRPRQTSNDFLQVSDADIGQYLLQIRYRQNRLGGSATVPVSRRVGLAVLEGEWIEYLGLTWLITGWQVNEMFEFSLVLAQTSADVYSSSGIIPGPIVVPKPPLVNPSLLSTVQNFRVEVGSVQGEDGYEVPVLRFTWDPPGDPTITMVRIFYQVNGGDQIFEAQCTEPESGEYITSANVVPGKVYVARATIATDPDRFKTFTPYETTAQATGRATVTAFLDSLGGDVKAAWENARLAVETLRLRMEEIAAAAIEGAGVVASESSVSVRFRDAIAVALTGQRASIEDTGEALRAFAEAFLAVQATVGNLSADGLIRMTAEAGSGDVVARIVIQVRATTGNDWVTVGTIWEAGFTGGDPGQPFARIINRASQHLWVGDDDDEAAVWGALIDGVWYLKNLMVEKAQIPLGELVAFDRPIDNENYSAPNPTATSTLELKVLDSFTIDNPSSNSVKIYINGAISASNSASAGTIATGITLLNQTQGNEQIGLLQLFQGLTGADVSALVNLALIDTNPAVGSNTYQLCQGVYRAGGFGTTTFAFDGVDVDFEYGWR